MVRLGGSAIAENVGRDLAFAASRHSARSHPYVRGCIAPSALHMFGIFAGDHWVGRGCSRPWGQRRSCFARTRHDRAHICRGQDDRGRLQSRAAGCSRRAASPGRPDGFVVGTGVPRAGLPRVVVSILAVIRTGAPDSRCSCTRSVRSTQPAPARHRRIRIVCGRPLFQETPHLYQS